MINDFLSLLRCPYCESNLKLEKSWKQHYIEVGIIKCSCDTYPLIDGIIYLTKDEVFSHQKAVEQLESNQLNKAVKTLLKERKKLIWIHLSLLFLKQRGLSLSKKWFDRVMDICSFLSPSSADWYQYCKVRDTRITFKIAENSTAVVMPNSTVVDCCTGMGQFLNLPNIIKNSMFSFGVDFSFKLLFLSRIFFANKDTFLVCADLNHGIPFKTGKIDIIFFNDCFMYLPSQKKVLAESNRVLKINGKAIINHVHLPSKTNIVPGYTVSPKMLRQMALPLTTYVATDSEIVKNMTLEKSTIYQPVKNFKTQSEAHSFSAILHSSSLNKEPIKLIKKTDFLVDLTDFTEDEYLKDL